MVMPVPPSGRHPDEATMDIRAALPPVNRPPSNVEPDAESALPEGSDTPALPPDQMECRRLLDQIRQRCPGLVPAAPRPASTVGPPVRVDVETADELFRTAALHTTGLLANGRPTGAAVVWSEYDRELAVAVGEVRTRLERGLVAVTIPVWCNEIGRTEVHVSFAVGDPERPAGLLAATEERPRGPQLIVDLWGEALVAFAWRLLVTVTAHLALAAGTDEDGNGLVPAAMAAAADGMAVLPQARHPFDRLVRP